MAWCTMVAPLVGKAVAVAGGRWQVTGSAVTVSPPVHGSLVRYSGEKAGVNGSVVRFL